MKTVSVLILALALSGCASYSGSGLRPGASDNDVRQAMGRPAVELRNPDGSRELVYPKGPLGTQTFIAHLDAGGALKGIEQVLDDDHFRNIHEGQTQDQVLRMIGPPGETMRFPGGNHAWQYRFMDTWGYTSEFNVTFNPAGIVVAKIAIRLDQDRDHSK
jgi:outer membrane protein assembly factor BamE (lipoprotein component of BamABCDE complex)